MTAATQTFQVGDQTITARELTFGEVRAWLVEETASSQRDPVHALAFPGLGLDELARMCDAPIEILETFTPCELAPLVEAVRALNPPFFRVRKLLMAHVDRLSTEEESPSSTASPVR